MADKFEIDFKQFNVDEACKHYTDAMAVAVGNKTLARFNASPTGGNNSRYTIADIITQHGAKASLTESQRLYLLRLCKEDMPEYAQYVTDFFAWYDSRPDMSELYQYGISQNWYLQHPVNGNWVYKDGDGWDKAWEQKPVNPDMFWRVTGDYSVRRFREVSREHVFSEGELVRLRDPYVGRWDFDPLVGSAPDGSTPAKTEMRLGTVMQLTTEINRHSRGGKGSRNINVLWFGKSSPTLVPERCIKFMERKRRAKK